MSARAAASVLALSLAGVVGCSSDPPPRAPDGHLVPRCGEGPLPPTCTIATGRYPRYPTRPATIPASDVRDGAGRVAGAPSEPFTAATRAFHASRWPDAILALDAVARGDAGDERETREIAEYQLAISLYNARELRSAEDLFVAITSDTAHHRQQEGVLWTARLLGSCPSARSADVLLALPPESFQPHFRNPQQAELARRLDLLLARRLLERREPARALAILDTLRSTTIAAEAERCRATADAR